MKTRLTILLVVGSISVAALAAACGGGSSNTPTSTPAKPDQTVTLQAKNVKFLPDKLTIPMGSVIELKLENLDATEHDVQVDGLDANVMSGGSMSAGHGGSAMMVAVHTKANQMGSVVFTANKKGTYNFYCTIAGHKEAGMVGTLTVE